MQTYIQSRKIQEIVHFTKLENLDSILKNGLLGRDTLGKRNITTSVNDQYRFDGLPDAICCSISFPNYKMFYSMRRSNPETDWAVIRIKPEVLWLKKSAFCQNNAANSAVSQIPLNQRMGQPALEKLFLDIDGLPQRSQLLIPDNYTTHPQAEVLILEPIEPHNIIDINFDDVSRINDVEKIKSIIAPFKANFVFYSKKSLFDARCDYSHW